MSQGLLGVKAVQLLAQLVVARAHGEQVVAPLLHARPATRQRACQHTSSDSLNSATALKSLPSHHILLGCNPLQPLSPTCTTSRWQCPFTRGPMATRMSKHQQEGLIPSSTRSTAISKVGHCNMQMCILQGSPALGGAISSASMPSSTPSWYGDGSCRYTPRCQQPLRLPEGSTMHQVLVYALSKAPLQPGRTGMDAKRWAPGPPWAWS